MNVDTRRDICNSWR